MGEATVKTGWVLLGLVAVAIVFSPRALLVMGILFHLLLLFVLLGVAFRRMAPTTTTEDQLARTVEDQEARLAVLQRTVEDLRRQQAGPPSFRRPRPRPVRDDEVTVPGHRPAY